MYIIKRVFVKNLTEGSRGFYGLKRALEIAKVESERSRRRSQYFSELEARRNPKADVQPIPTVDGDDGERQVDQFFLCKMLPNLCAK